MTAEPRLSKTNWRINEIKPGVREVVELNQEAIIFQCPANGNTDQRLEFTHTQLVDALDYRFREAGIKRSKTRCCYQLLANILANICDLRRR